MFRSLAQHQSSSLDLLSPRAAEPTEASVTRPRSHSVISEHSVASPQSKLAPENIFSIVIDTNANRKTLAKWHVDRPEDLLDLLAQLAADV